MDNEAKQIPSNLQTGYCFTEELNLKVSNIIDGAIFVGDMNPLHHSDDNQFESVIASGSHIMGVFTALLPSHFMRYGPVLGAQMDMKFLAPIFPDIKYTMKWEIVSTLWKQRIGGTLITLFGTIICPDGKNIVETNASIFLYP